MPLQKNLMSWFASGNKFPIGPLFDRFGSGDRATCRAGFVVAADEEAGIGSGRTPAPVDGSFWDDY